MQGKPTWYQRQQQKERTEEKQHHHPIGHHHPVAEKFPNVPAWLTELITILEAIWAALPASQSEPNHAVAQKLAAFKAKLPDTSQHSAVRDDAAVRYDSQHSAVRYD